MEAWRATRSEFLGEALEEISAGFENEPSLRRHRDWMECEARHDPGDIHRLVNGLISRKVDETVARLDRLKFWPADPRIGGCLVAAVEEPPFVTRKGSRFWRCLLGMIALHLDSRFLDRIRVARTRLDHIRDDSIRFLIDERLGLILRQWQPPKRSLQDDEIVACEALLRAQRLGRTPGDEEVEFLEGRLGSPSRAFEKAAAKRRDQALEKDFLRLVAEEPDDDEPRQVYADWLLEKGDPRGELIALQLREARQRLTLEEQKRVHELLRRHIEDWLGDLYWTIANDPPERQLLNGQGPIFRRGFLDEVWFSEGRRAMDKLHRTQGDLRWATVRVAHRCGVPETQNLVLQDMIGLRELYCEHGAWSFLKALLIGAPRKLRVLQFRVISSLGGDEMTDVFKQGGLPELRELRFPRIRLQFETLAKILESPLGRQLIRVEVMGDITKIPAFLQLLTQRVVDGALSALKVGISTGGCFCCQRDEAGRWSVLQLDNVLVRDGTPQASLLLPEERRWQRLLDEVTAGIRALPYGAVTRLELQPTPPADARRALEEAARARGVGEVVTLDD